MMYVQPLEKKKKKKKNQLSIQKYATFSKMTAYDTLQFFRYASERNICVPVK